MVSRVYIVCQCICVRLSCTVLVVSVIIMFVGSYTTKIIDMSVYEENPLYQLLQWKSQRLYWIKINTDIRKMMSKQFNILIALLKDLNSVILLFPWKHAVFSRGNWKLSVNLLIITHWYCLEVREWRFISDIVPQPQINYSLAARWEIHEWSHAQHHSPSLSQNGGF